MSRVPARNTPSIYAPHIFPHTVTRCTLVRSGFAYSRGTPCGYPAAGGYWRWRVPCGWRVLETAWQTMVGLSQHFPHNLRVAAQKLVGTHGAFAFELEAVDNEQAGAGDDGKDLLAALFALTNRSRYNCLAGKGFRLHFQGTGVDDFEQFATPVGVGSRPGRVGAHHARQHSGWTLPGDFSVLFAQHACMRGLCLILWGGRNLAADPARQRFQQCLRAHLCQDRKSTRLNSSHV